MRDNQQIDPLQVRQSPYLKDLQLEKKIREYQWNDHLTGQHYTYLNVSKPDYAVPENHQIEQLEWRNNLNVNDSKPQNTIPEYQQIEDSFMTALPVSEHFET